MEGYPPTPHPHITDGSVGPEKAPAPTATRKKADA